MSGNVGKWIEAMKICKSATKPSYLFGDIDHHNAAASCNQTFIPENSGPRWIGVARQQYVNKDDGKYFHSNIYFELLFKTRSILRHLFFFSKSDLIFIFDFWKQTLQIHTYTHVCTNAHPPNHTQKER